MNKKIQSVSVVSVLKIMPFVYLVLGLILGAASYIYAKYATPGITPRIVIWQWLLAVLVYGALFCLILTIFTVLGVILYNKLNQRFGSIEVLLEDK